MYGYVGVQEVEVDENFGFASNQYSVDRNKFLEEPPITTPQNIHFYQFKDHNG